MKTYSYVFNKRSVRLFNFIKKSSSYQKPVRLLFFDFEDLHNFHNFEK